MKHKMQSRISQTVSALFSFLLSHDARLLSVNNTFISGGFYETKGSPHLDYLTRPVRLHSVLNYRWLHFPDMAGDALSINVDPQPRATGTMQVALSPSAA